MRPLIAALALPLVLAPVAEAVPLIGGSGLCPNARNLAAYIQSTYPNVSSIGGVRADRLPDHPSGHALDIMVGNNTALGNRIAADIRTQTGRFAVKYMLWQTINHYDHIHVTVA
jgi:hypothetical protein